MMRLMDMVKDFTKISPKLNIKKNKTKIACGLLLGPQNSCASNEI